MPKIVYIAHQINGDIKANVKSVLKICKEIHSKEIIPFAPYLVAIQYLDDNVSEERALGIAANRECFKRGIVDEVWLCGSRISEGMRKEIKLAMQHNIPIRCHNKKLEKGLEKARRS
jgi:hypothetical protein